jgi:nicotinamide riboside transporter PnuC
MEGPTGSREDRHLNCKLSRSQHVWQSAAETGDWKHSCVAMILNWVTHVCVVNCKMISVHGAIDTCTEVGTAVVLRVNLFAVN